MKFKPNFDRLKKVLLRDGEPDIVPFYELFADDEIIMAVTGKPISYKSKVKFYYDLGYDYVPAWPRFDYAFLKFESDDTAIISKGKRGYIAESTGLIENRSDFQRYKWPVIDDYVTEHVNGLMKYLPAGMKIIIMPEMGIFGNVISLMGYEPLSYAIYDDEQLVYDMFEKVGKNHIEVVKKCIEESDIKMIGAIVLADDMGYKHSTMISPDHLRKYVFPWQKRFVEMVHGYDLPCILHCCGDIEEIMSDLIDFVKIDARHSFEDNIMPVIEAKKKYGDKIAILGGVDIDFLCRANESQIRLYVDRIIDVCAPGGGYALGTGNSVTNYVPVNNYLIMLDEGRRKGVYNVI